MCGATRTEGMKSLDLLGDRYFSLQEICAKRRAQQIEHYSLGIAENVLIIADRMSRRVTIKALVITLPKVIEEFECFWLFSFFCAFVELSAAMKLNQVKFTVTMTIYRFFDATKDDAEKAKIDGKNSTRKINENHCKTLLPGIFSQRYWAAGRMVEKKLNESERKKTQGKTKKRTTTHNPTMTNKDDGERSFNIFKIGKV